MKELLAFLGGAAVGAAVAILLAPEKGSVTRERIKDFVDTEQEKFLKTVKKPLKNQAIKVQHGARNIEDKARMVEEFAEEL